MVKLKGKPSLEIAQERADRLIRIREALGPSRPKFCEKFGKYGISISAVQGWEDIRWNGLTENGANLLARALNEEGFSITVEWLMFGVGDTPSFLENSNNAPRPSPMDESNLLHELHLFLQHHPGAVSIIIEDDGLAPWYTPGDYVAGINYFDRDIKKTIDRPSIVQTLSDGTLVTRIVTLGDGEDSYTLKCTNPKTTVAHSLIKNVKLCSAAPILWHRKPEPKE